MNYWQRLRRRLGRKKKKIVVELRHRRHTRGLFNDRESITCPVCRRRSYNPNDIRERYCGFCCSYY